MATMSENGHPQWENTVTHDITDIKRSDIEISTRNKLVNIISGALKSKDGEFPLEEFYYLITEEYLEVYDRNAVYLVGIGIGSFEQEEIEWIKNNLPLFNTSEDFQDPDTVKLEFKKWKNSWWNVFRINGSDMTLIGYVRPLLDHLIIPFDIDSDGPTPRHYFEDRCDNTIVTEAEKHVINNFIMSQVGNVSIKEIHITPEVLELYVLDSLYVNVSVKPTWATNKNVTLSIDDSTIASLSEDNVIYGQSEGTCNLIVSSDEEDSEGNPVVSITVPINVIQLYTLVNDLYDITTTGDGRKYITGIKPDTRVHDLVGSFKNNIAYLHVYTANGNDVTNDAVEIVQTGMTVDLAIDGNVFDHLDVVVPGDVNGDGLVSSVDLTAFNRHINNIDVLQYPYDIAADVNQDGIVNLDDRSMLINYINTGRF